MEIMVFGSQLLHKTEQIYFKEKSDAATMGSKWSLVACLVL